ncbi:MAG: hypothetical protein JXQ73_25155 [Phycisphaerae bacterium]|nr:hypothetical protein [Phycisphaerae bacterium]
METDIVAKYPAFLQEEFRQDIKFLLETEEKIIQALADFLSSGKSYRDVLKDETWVPMVEATGLAVEDFTKILRPLRYLCYAARLERTSPASIVEVLSAHKIIVATSPAGFQPVLTLAVKLQPLVDAFDEENPPALPALRIQHLRSTTNTITEFVNEFDTERDEPDSYVPELKKLHVYTTFEATFKEKHVDPMVVAMTKRDLDQVIKWLLLARIQHEATEQVISGLQTGKPANA